MNDLLDIAEALGNEYGGIAEDGVEAADVTGYVDTGSYTVNLLLSGDMFKGLPANKVTALAGEEATGKTFFALAIMKNFLDSDPHAGVIFFESEGAVSKSMLETRGIDTNRVYIAPVATVEEFRTQAKRALERHLAKPKEKRRPLMFVLDSLGMLSTEKETTDMEAGTNKRDMTRTQLIRAAFRVLTLKLGMAGIPLLITNHVYAVIGSMFPSKEVAGGGGLKYAASTIVTLGKAKEKKGGEQIGVRIRLKVPKSRLTRENSEVLTLLSYEKGLGRYYGLADLAVKYGIFKKVSTRIELPDGKKVFQSVLDTEGENYYTQEWLEQINEAAKADFLYGSDFTEQESVEEIEETNE